MGLRWALPVPLLAACLLGGSLAVARWRAGARALPRPIADPHELAERVLARWEAALDPGLRKT